MNEQEAENALYKHYTNLDDPDKFEKQLKIDVDQNMKNKIFDALYWNSQEIGYGYYCEKCKK